jgi:hypothetical protein
MEVISFRSRGEEKDVTDSWSCAGGGQLVEFDRDFADVFQFDARLAILI